jgi:hypothetical protein
LRGSGIVPRFSVDRVATPDCRESRRAADGFVAWSSLQRDVFTGAGSVAAGVEAVL